MFTAIRRASSRVQAHLTHRSVRIPLALALRGSGWMGWARCSNLVDAAAADAQNLGLLADRQVVSAVDHRFALSNPALVSAPSKKSFSKVSSPILACSDFTSIAGTTAWPPPGPNTSAAPLSSCAFHAVI